MAAPINAPLWSRLDGERLRECRKSALMTQAQLACLLDDKLGVKTTQASVSRWESGEVVPPHASRLREFMHAYAQDASGEVEETAKTGPRVAGKDRNLEDTEAAFRSLAREASGEPLLGPAQFELVRGMSKRLENGPPLSLADRRTYLDQLRILGVTIHDYGVQQGARDVNPQSPWLDREI